jgi:hypothetical protein
MCILYMETSNMCSEVRWVPRVVTLTSGLKQHGTTRNATYVNVHEYTNARHVQMSKSKHQVVFRERAVLYGANFRQLAQMQRMQVSWNLSLIPSRAFIALLDKFLGGHYLQDTSIRWNLYLLQLLGT